MTDLPRDPNSMVTGRAADGLPRAVRASAASVPRDASGNGIAGGSPATAVETEPSTLGPPKRLLMVTGHFAPSAEVGVRRIVSICRFLADRGCPTDVITIPPSELAHVVPGSWNDVPSGTQVVDVPLGKLPIAPALIRLRRLLFSRPGASEASTPTGRQARSNAPATKRLAGETRRSVITVLEEYRLRRWVRRVAAAASRLPSAGSYWAVMSSGPPHSAHIAAARVARRLGIPFVMDLRDPWTVPELLPAWAQCHIGRTLARRGERACVRQAALVVANNPAARDALVAKYPDAAERIVSVMNGSDGLPARADPPAGPFRIAYAGSLYVGRDPRTLFRAIRIALDRVGVAPGDIVIEFAGDDAYEGVPLSHLAGESGVAPSFEFRGRLGPDETAALLRRAHLLVSLPQSAPLCVPAKLFEYVNYPAWLLVFAAGGDATEQAFRDSGAGLVTGDSIEDAATFIADCLRRYRAGERPSPLNLDGRFAREPQLQHLWQRLGEIRKLSPAIQPGSSR